MLLKTEGTNPPQSPDPADPFVDVSSISDHFGRHGLTYTDDQTATFYTALQTKGFVVLSGISGTGKSKIAQGFVGMLPDPSSESSPVAIDRESLIELSVKPYTRKYKRVVIPVDQLGTLPPMNPGDQIVVRLIMDGVSGTGRLVSQQHPGGYSVTYLFFRGPIGERIRDMELGAPLLLVPDTRGDDEGLESISIFTDQSQLPAEVMAPAPESTRNSLFLAVRPDWRDSTSLLGYYNPLTETYEWTEFLHFMLRAVDDYRANEQDALAWFVILDEMNLAHVEYYFADLLSIIESGRDEKGWSREPVRLTYPDAKTDNPPPHEIYLPPNLYIIGTVNMDETTHAFSPKVLDRAFTIELTDVDFSDYPPQPSDTGAEISDDDRQALLKAFTRHGIFAQVSKTDIHTAVTDHPQLRQWLQNLNERLAQYQFHFGYRVFDEIAQFIFNADRNGMFGDWTSAFDHVVFMKVLPKFSGSHARLHDPLEATLAWANNPAGKVSVPITGDTDPDAIALAPVAAPQLERVATRVQRMIDTLEKDGFVSFG